MVFSSIPDMTARIDDPDLDVGPDDVLVLQNAGPKGAPGMPEAGYLPIPRKILATGVKDMVRISDARMSGTSYGACILHVSPESAAGGPLGAVRTGDLITVDVPGRRIHLHLDDAIDGGVLRRLPHAEMALDGVDVDDRVVHEPTDGQKEADQGRAVEGHAQRHHGQERDG